MTVIIYDRFGHSIKWSQITKIEEGPSPSTIIRLYRESSHRALILPVETTTYTKLEVV